MELFAVPGLPEIRDGDDLAAMIDERVDLREGDVVVVASTVVSKAEGRTFDLSDFPASERAEAVADRLAEIAGEEKDPRFAQAVIEESTELIMEAPFLLTATRFGHIGVNAGIDQSNVPDGDLLLLPERPSESAARIRGDRGRPRRRQRHLRAPVQTRPARGRDRLGRAPGQPRLARRARPRRPRDGRHRPERDRRTRVGRQPRRRRGRRRHPVVVVRDWEFGDHDGSDNHFREVEGDFVRQALRQWTFDD